MTLSDIKAIIRFTIRPGMYIYPLNRDTICAFIHGIDYGSERPSKWCELLKDYISNTYNINGGAPGWPRQIELYSNKFEMNWDEAFFDLMNQLFENAFNEKMTQEILLYRKTLQK